MVQTAVHQYWYTYHNIACKKGLKNFLKATPLKIVTGFWKTDHFVTFDIIDNSVYLRHSKWYYWINKCLNQSQITWKYVPVEIA